MNVLSSGLFTLAASVSRGGGSLRSMNSTSIDGKTSTREKYTPTTRLCVSCSHAIKCNVRTKIRIEIHPGGEGGDRKECRASNERERANDSDRTYLAKFARTSRSVERKVFEQQIKPAAVENES